MKRPGAVVLAEVIWEMKEFERRREAACSTKISLWLRELKDVDGADVLEALSMAARPARPIAPPSPAVRRPKILPQRLKKTQHGRLITRGPLELVR